ELLDLVDDETHRYRAGGTTTKGDDAESAAVVTAVLHLHEGAGVVIHALDQMPGGFPHAHDVVDLHLVIERRAKNHGPIALGPELVIIADDEVDLVHLAKAARFGLGGAAGDDDAGGRV